MVVLVHRSGEIYPVATATWALLQSGCWALVGIVPLPYVACCELGAQISARERHQSGEVDARSGRARGGRGGAAAHGCLPPCAPVAQAMGLTPQFLRCIASKTILKELQAWLHH